LSSPAPSATLNAGMKRATLCLLVLAGTLRAGDELDATAMATAAEEAGELVKQARKAPAKDRDARRAVKAAYLLLEPQATSAAASRARPGTRRR